MQYKNLDPVHFGNTFNGIEFILPNYDAYNLSGAKILMQLIPVNGGAKVTYSTEGETPLLKITGAYSYEIIEHDVVVPAGEYYYDMLIIFDRGAKKIKKSYIGGVWQILPVVTTETV